MGQSRSIWLYCPRAYSNWHSTNSVWEFHFSTSTSTNVLSDFNFCLADECKMASHCFILSCPLLLVRLIHMFLVFLYFGFFLLWLAIYICLFIFLLCSMSFSSWFAWSFFFLTSSGLQSLVLGTSTSSVYGLPSNNFNSVFFW